MFSSWKSSLVGRCFDLLPGRDRLALELEPALRTPDPVRAVQQELAAHGAFQAGASKDRDQLLVERPVESRDGRHSDRNTPVTFPRIWTCWA